MIVKRVESRDIDSFYVRVFSENNILIAKGHYNVRSNMAHITIERKFKNNYDADQIGLDIEERNIKIEM
jgi:hypothetical protein